MTNREYMINLLLDGLESRLNRVSIDDAGASEEAMIYYNINCPYYAGDKRAYCRKEGSLVPSREVSPLHLVAPIVPDQPNRIHPSCYFSSATNTGKSFSILFIHCSESRSPNPVIFSPSEIAKIASPAITQPCF